MKKKKKKQPNWLGIILGFALICGSFWFSLSKLATIVSPIIEKTTQNPSTVTKKEFLKQLAPHAQELQEGYGILPSIILGQAILESNWGTSELASEYKNLFGVKAYGNQAAVSLDTKEYVDEQWIVIKGSFRVYDSWAESIDEHTLLLLHGVSWNPRKYEKVLTASNYKVAAQALQDAGYATDPTYAEKIKDVIESYHLDQYDR